MDIYVHMNCKATCGVSTGNSPSIAHRRLLLLPLSAVPTKEVSTVRNTAGTHTHT